MVDEKAQNVLLHDDSGTIHEEEEVLAVVVTNVDISNTSSLQVPSSLYGIDVEFIVSSGVHSYCVRRALNDFIQVLQLFKNSTSSSTNSSSKNIPEFPSRSARNDAALAKWCGDMTSFLSVQHTVLSTMPEWMDLIKESELAQESSSHMTAIQFILQPFPYEKIYVPRGSKHEVILHATEEGQYLVWKFELDDHDIDFCVLFDPTPVVQTDSTDRTNKPIVQEVKGSIVVHTITRYSSSATGIPIEGMYVFPGAGKVTLTWDNSYSRIRGKNLLYQTQVVSKGIMDSANAAADALDEAIRSNKKQAVAGNILTHRTSLTNNTTLSLLDLNGANLVAQAYKMVPTAESLTQHSWIVSAPAAVAGRLASRLFGSQNVDQSEARTAHGEENDDEHLSPQDAEAKSLLEELNGLNMQLLERVEALEDTIGKLTVERDQARSKVHLSQVEYENVSSQVQAKDVELQALKDEIQRMQREREAWREIQAERDALLEEKHRWAMSDEFAIHEHEEEAKGVEDQTGSTSDLDNETKQRLEQELGQAEAWILRLRAELGYSLSNHLTGSRPPARLEKVVKEMVEAKKDYETKMKLQEEEMIQLRQQLIKYRAQKRVLVTEIRNMKSQTEGQVSVAMAEASEARMVNRRLKKQNELLLTQIRTLVDEAREQKVAPTEEQDRKGKDSDEEHEEKQTTSLSQEGNDSSMDHEETSTVPYTLNEADLAILNGQSHFHQEQEVKEVKNSYSDRHPSSLGRSSSGSKRAASQSTQRQRLIAFFKEKDPSMLSQVDEMLQSYQGVEQMLFDSLELKYSLMEQMSMDGDQQ